MVRIASAAGPRCAPRRDPPAPSPSTRRQTLNRPGRTRAISGRLDESFAQPRRDIIFIRCNRPSRWVLMFCGFWPQKVRRLRLAVGRGQSTNRRELKLIEFFSHSVLHLVLAGSALGPEAALLSIAAPNATRERGASEKPRQQLVARPLAGRQKTPRRRRRHGPPTVHLTTTPVI